MDFEDFILHVHKIFLRTKRLRHYINGYYFQRAFDLADKEKLKALVDKGDLNGLKIYVEKLLMDNLEMQKVGTLREIAKAYRVANYYCLTRNQLIEEIKNAKIEHDENCKETNRLQS